MLTVKGSHIVSVRELELRRETLAAMRLRGAFDGGRPFGLPRNTGCAAESQRAATQSIHPLRILSIGDYEGLRISREWLLRHAGFHAESLSSCAPLDVFTVRRFSIALLCHSVPFNRAVRIADILHRYQPRISVVRLTYSDPPGEGGFDREVESLFSPEELLRVLREEASRLRSAVDR